MTSAVPKIIAYAILITVSQKAAWHDVPDNRARSCRRRKPFANDLPSCQIVLLFYYHEKGTSHTAFHITRAEHSGYSLSVYCAPTLTQSSESSLTGFLYYFIFLLVWVSVVEIIIIIIIIIIVVIIIITMIPYLFSTSFRSKSRSEVLHNVMYM